jgi:hypothetical protein
LRKTLIIAPLGLLAALLFSGCEATQVGNFDGSGKTSDLSHLPQARHEAWETDARYGNLPQSR